MNCAIFWFFFTFFIAVVKTQGTLPNSFVSPSNNSNTVNNGKSIETSPSPVPSEPGSKNSPNSTSGQPFSPPSGNGQDYRNPSGLPSFYQSIVSAPSPARPIGSGYPLKQVNFIPSLSDFPRQASQALLLNPSGYSGQQQQQPIQPGGYGSTGGGYGNQGNIQPYGPSASPNCVDVHAKCDYFVSLGKCQNQFAPFVRQVCPRSCNACEVLPYGMTSSNSDSGYGNGGGPGQHAQLAPGSYLYFGPPYTNLGPATGSGGCCGGNTGSQSYGQVPGGAVPGCGSNSVGGCGQTAGNGYGSQNQNVGYPGGSGCTNPNGCPTLPGQGQNQYPGGTGSGCTNPNGCPTLPGQSLNQYPGGSGSGCSNPGGCPTLPGQSTGTGYSAGNVVPAGQGQYPGGSSGCTNPNGCPTLPGQNQNIGGNYPSAGGYNG